jgi:hypothetical protein
MAIFSKNPNADSKPMEKGPNDIHHKDNRNQSAKERSIKRQDSIGQTHDPALKT